MMDKVIKFNLSGYDPFIDYIKAYAIICVLIGHTFPYLDYMGYGLWAGMQVPLFVLVQTLHCFKQDNPSFKFHKIFWRIIVPFLIVQSVVFLISFLLTEDTMLIGLIKSFIVSGGFGPGSYFPWIYLQLAIILPFAKKIMDKYSQMQNLFFFLIICELLEILSSLVHLPDFIHRLLAVRYFFLLYLGWTWAKDGIVINWKTNTLSFASLLSIIYFEYFSINDEPFFYCTDWSFHRWPCFFYVAIWGGRFINFIYLKLSPNSIIDSFVKKLAKCSYEIFLIQMVVVQISYPVLFIHDSHIFIFLRILLVFVTSIWGGFLFNKIYGALMIKYKM